MFPVAKQMMALFPTNVCGFVEGIFKLGVLGQNRLHIALQLEHFQVSPMIILADLFTSGSNLEEVKRGALAFPPEEVLSVIRLLARHFNNPKALVEEMCQVDCFRENFKDKVHWARLKWTETKVCEFIEAVCSALNAPIPGEVRPIVIFARLDKIYNLYQEGEIELEDFYRICVSLTNENDAELQVVLEYFADKSNPITDILSTRRGVRFLPECSASNFIPSCTTPMDDSVHRLATNGHTLIQDEASVMELAGLLKENSQFAIFLHRSANFPGRCEILGLRFRDHVVFYLPHASGHLRTQVAGVLACYASHQRVFLFSQATVLEYLEGMFGWKPRDFVDSEELAKVQGVQKTVGVGSLAKFLGAAKYCRRARNFADNAVPSSIALLHRNIDVSIVYHFCVTLLGMDAVSEKRKPASTERSY